MELLFSLFIIMLTSSCGAFVVKYKIYREKCKNKKTYSPLKYYYYIVMIWSLLAGVVSQIVLYFFQDFLPVKIIPLLGINASLITVVISIFAINRGFNARKYFEIWSSFCLGILSSVSFIVTIIITVIIVVKTVQFFLSVNVFNFIFGFTWEPQNYKIDCGNVFGIVPIFYNTLYIIFLTVLISLPISLLSAVYLSCYINKTLSSILKPLIEVMASIPSVVHGFIATLTFAPFVKRIADFFGITSSYENAFTSAIFISIMILPMMISLIMEVIKHIPRTLSDASLALGATYTETVRKVIIPSSMPGIYAILILGISRILGETMIVAMAAGMTAKYTLNPFDSMTTFTVQIVNLITGDESFDNPKALAAFALSFVLITFTFLLNLLSNFVLNKYNAKYAARF